MLQQKDGWKVAVLGIFLAAFASGFALLAKAPPAQQKNYVGGDTCLACHDIEEAFAKNPHYKSWKDESLPWDKRGCETCHGPGEAHVDGGGDVAQIFRFTEASPQDISETCLDCHLKQNETLVNFLRNEHGLNTVACTECHTVHTPQKMEGLLKARTPALCYDCHNEVRSQFNRPFRHKVNEGLMDCADCHNRDEKLPFLDKRLLVSLRLAAIGVAETGRDLVDLLLQILDRRQRVVSVAHNHHTADRFAPALFLVFYGQFDAIPKTHGRIDATTVRIRPLFSTHHCEIGLASFEPFG